VLSYRICYFERPRYSNADSRLTERGTGATRPARLEAVHAPVGETQSRAGDQVSHGARDQHFIRFGLGRDARRNMHRDTADVVANQLALASVEPGADLQSKRTKSFAHRTGASYRPIRSIEGGEQSVTRRVHLAAAERGQLFSHHRVVVIEQVAPPQVAHLGCALGGAHYIGEHHGSEYSVRVRTMAHAGNKFFDLV
jgi:hypothetical protein